ncbi:MAG: hypothetical protein A2Y63_01685 [Candidatus Riflebacteria bacterium RBG_13_59_9]|nr:MAG: hypothetical protein A2Y63_01685 [Candidatus Riflebacteria bacterium RBG_13_59_9]
MASPDDQPGDRTDPFLDAVPATSREELLSQTGEATLERLHRGEETHLRWTHTGEPPEHLLRLLPKLPVFLPGCEDLLLVGHGFTARDFDFTLADSELALSASDVLPLLAQAYELDKGFAEHAGSSVGYFDPARLYVRNQRRNGLRGLDDLRLRFYHLEDLSPDAEAYTLTRGLADWLHTIVGKRESAAGQFADNLGSLRAFLEAVRDQPADFASLAFRLKVAVASAERSNVGLVRENNEDAYMVLHSRLNGVSESASVFAVADGMGGHNAGELASSLCLELLRFYSGLWPLGRASRQRSTPTLIGEHLRTISAEILDSAATDPELVGMGTTLTGVFLTYRGWLEKSAPLVSVTSYVFNVGDSRAFVLDSERLRALTRDHSYVQQMVDSGSITEEEAYAHPQRNVILQGVGITPEIQPDVAFFRLPLESFTVICTDGLTDLVREPRLVELASEADSPDSLAEALVREALTEGGKDNISVIVLAPRLAFE